jgi:hypothetical protein
MIPCPDCPPCKRCGVAPWVCFCESCSCPPLSFFTHEHFHERSAGSGGEYASEPAHPPYEFHTVDGVRHTISFEPPTVIYLSNDYHLNTLKKRQAELDKIYYDLYGYKGPFDYYQWRMEYELNGTQYALDRLVDLWTPEMQQAKEGGERYFSKKPGWVGPACAILLPGLVTAFLWMLILHFVH